MEMELLDLIPSSDSESSENEERLIDIPDDLEDLCSVCYQYIEDKVVFKCSHEFCLPCVNNFVYHKIKNCPLCRKKLKTVTDAIEKMQEIKLFIQIIQDENQTLLSIHSARGCNLSKVGLFIMYTLFFAILTYILYDEEQN